MLLKLIFINIFANEVIVKQALAMMEYQNYDDLSHNLKEFASAHPDKAHLYSIGKSVENRDIWVMAVAGSQPTVHAPLRPEVKYVGNMYGNQLPTREMLFHLIHILLENPHNDSNIDYILQSMRVHILVSLNPDGAEKSFMTRQCTGNVGRNNSNNFDLNRNFPDFYFCNEALLQPETQAVVDWLENNTFILSANLHTGALVASYGYDNFPHSESATSPNINPTEDDDVLKHIALQYSLNNPSMQNGTCNEESFFNGVTNGGYLITIIFVKSYH